MTCPECKRTLFEDEDLTHDGYMGSPYAHNGRGSYGLARHHYYYVCHCGWSERPDISARKARVARRNSRVASYTWNGVKLPPSATDMSQCTVLNCRSRQSKAEELALVLARQAGDIGFGTGHSLCASYTYSIVRRDLMRRAEQMVASGAFRGLRSRSTVVRRSCGCAAMTSQKKLPPE